MQRAQKQLKEARSSLEGERAAAGPGPAVVQRLHSQMQDLQVSYCLVLSLPNPHHVADLLVKAPICVGVVSEGWGSQIENCQHADRCWEVPTCQSKSSCHHVCWAAMGARSSRLANNLAAMTSVKSRTRLPRHWAARTALQCCQCTVHSCPHLLHRPKAKTPLDSILPYLAPNSLLGRVALMRYPLTLIANNAKQTSILLMVQGARRWQIQGCKHPCQHFLNGLICDRSAMTNPKHADTKEGWSRMRWRPPKCELGKQQAVMQRAGHASPCCAISIRRLTPRLWPPLQRLPA